jgi:hypothetical protein
MVSPRRILKESKGNTFSLQIFRMFLGQGLYLLFRRTSVARGANCRQEARYDAHSTNRWKCASSFFGFIHKRIPPLLIDLATQLFGNFGGNHVVAHRQEFAVVSFQIRTSTTAARAAPFEEVDQAGGSFSNFVPKVRRSMCRRHLERDLRDNNPRECGEGVKTILCPDLGRCEK